MKNINSKVTYSFGGTVVWGFILLGIFALTPIASADGILRCDPANQTKRVNETVNFTVTPLQNGNDRVYFWSAPGSSNSTEDGYQLNNFSTTYSNPGSYTVSVSSMRPGKHIQFCNVNIAQSSTPNPNISVNVTGTKREGSNDPYVNPLHLSSNESGIRLRLNYIVGGNPTSCVSTGFWAGDNQHTYSDSEPVWAPTVPGRYNYGVRCTGSNGQVAEDSTIVILQGQTNPPIPPVTLPTVSIEAVNSHLSYGGSTTLVWYPSSNARSCHGRSGPTIWRTSRKSTTYGSTFPTGALFNTTTYSIQCENSAGLSPVASVTVFVDDNNNDRRPTVNISADDTSIDEDDGTYINWNTANNPTSCTGRGGDNGWNGRSLNKDGGRLWSGSLDRDTTFRIQCENSAGVSNEDSVTIRVDDDRNNNRRRPSVTLEADRTSVTRGNGTYIEWDTTNNPTRCTASGGANGWSGNRDRDNGRFYTGPLYGNTTFRIYCSNSAGNDEDSVTIRVDNVIFQPPIANNPTVSITADAFSVPAGGSTTVRWRSNNTTTCTASGGSFGWSGLRSIGPGSFFTGSLAAGTTLTYRITCTNNVGASATDTVTISARPRTVSQPPRPTPTSLVLINSSIDRNQPIIPTLDNTQPRPGDEINYTVGYQNIGTGSITNLTLRMDLPFEVDYMFSTPNNPTRSGNTLIFNLGTLRANGEGTVSVRVRVRDAVRPGTNLNFPALLTYTDPSGSTQSVNANISAQVWYGPGDNNFNNGQNGENTTSLGASVFGSGYFLPNTIIGWLLLIILILALMLLSRYLYDNLLSNQRRPVQQHYREFDGE